MASIQGKNTTPELLVRSYLHRAGFRFRLHKKGVPGRPDLWLPKHNAAIFINGCFWHRHQGCKYATTPSQNKKFWKDKFSANVVRDSINHDALRHKGIRVLVVWECQLKTKASYRKTLPKIASWLASHSKSQEIPPPR